MAPLATGLLESGNHTVEVLADGMPFASASFTVTRLGTAFLQGAQGSYTLENLPTAGNDVRGQWSEGQQSFVITGR